MAVATEEGSFIMQMVEVTLVVRVAKVVAEAMVTKVKTIGTEGIHRTS
mgnify:CR=1 FL=1